MPSSYWLHHSPSILFYIIAQIILAFWLVLVYDLLEGRRTIDAVITKLFRLCFKMVESFENLDNIIYVERTGMRSSKKNETQKKYSSSLSRQSSETKPNTKLVLKFAYFKVRNHYLVQNFKRSIYFRNSQSHFEMLTQIDFCNEISKHDFVKSLKINT